MGVDASHIIRNDFYDVENRDKSKIFAEQTYQRLLDALCLPIHWDESNFFYDEWEGYRFHIPVYDYEVFYHKGLWRIESYYHYCQIVMHKGDLFWLRQALSDIARALGALEMWHATEYYTWNSDLLEDITANFEDWIKSAEERLGNKIPEYNQASIVAQGDVHIPDYEPIYHDTFQECNEKFNSLSIELSIKGFELLGIAQLYLNSYRCKKNNHVVLVNAQTLESVFPESYYIKEILPREFFLVIDKGKSAVYNTALEQVTDFVDGDFKWKWNKERNTEEIYNETAGIII